MLITKPCDMCTVLDLKCPGQEAHCARGHHCTSTTETCSLESSYEDHKPTCCDCQATLLLAGNG